MVLGALACIASAGPGGAVGYVEPQIRLTVASSKLDNTSYCRGLAFSNNRLLIGTTNRACALIDTSTTQVANTLLGRQFDACTLTNAYIFACGPALNGLANGATRIGYASHTIDNQPYTVSTTAFFDVEPKAMFAVVLTGNNTIVYVAGEFTMFNGSNARRLGVFKNAVATGGLNTFFEIGSVLGGRVNCIAPAAAADGGIYYGGLFTTTNPNTINFAYYKYSTNVVSPIAHCKGGEVLAIATDSTFKIVYVAGLFTSVGFTNVADVSMRIAMLTLRFQGQPDGGCSIASVPLPEGFSTATSIEALAVAPTTGNLYMGTNNPWTTTQGVTINRVARYNFQTGIWSAVGTGVPGACKYLKFTDEFTLYMGGDFTNVVTTTIQCAMVYKDVAPM